MIAGVRHLERGQAPERRRRQPVDDDHGKPLWRERACVVLIRHVGDDAGRLGVAQHELTAGERRRCRHWHGDPASIEYTEQRRDGARTVIEQEQGSIPGRRPASSAAWATRAASSARSA